MPWKSILPPASMPGALGRAPFTTLHERPLLHREAEPAAKLREEVERLDAQVAVVDLALVAQLPPDLRTVSTGIAKPTPSPPPLDVGSGR